jgi:hypothetical protein
LSPVLPPTNPPLDGLDEHPAATTSGSSDGRKNAAKADELLWDRIRTVPLKGVMGARTHERPSAK